MSGFCPPQGGGLTSLAFPPQGSVSAWSPADLEGLQVWLEPDSIQTSGATITAWNDVSDNSNHFNSPSGSPQVATVGSTEVFQGAINDYINGPDFSSAAWSAVSVHALVKMDSNRDGFDPVLSFGTAGTAQFCSIGWDAASQVTWRDTASTVRRDAVEIEDDGWHVVSWVASSGEFKTYIDGVHASTLTVTGNGVASVDVLQLGSWANSTVNMQGKIAELIVANAAHSDSDVASLWVYLKAKHGTDLLTQPSHLVVFLGDSLTTTTFSTSSDSAAKKAMDLVIADEATVDPHYYVIGKGGQSASGLTSGIWSEAVVDLASTWAGVSTKVCVVWAGTNDLAVDGDTPAQAHSDIEALCDKVSAAGYTVVVGNVLPRIFDNDTDRGTLNAAIGSNYTDYADYLWDVAGDSTIGDDGDETNGTYYQGDQIHLIAAGNAVAAGVLEAPLKQALGFTP